MPTEQLTLPLGALRNRALFSSHWLENRLPLEPEWAELRDEARDVLESMSEMWRVQRGRVGQALVQTLSIKQQEPKWSPIYTSRREHCFPDLWHYCSCLANA